MLVTANARLARSLLHDHAAAQSGAAWRPPEILPWEVWLGRLWHEQAGFARQPLLLTAAQEQLLWQEVLADSPEAGDWLDAGATARAAAQAWDLAHAWGLDLDRAGGDETDDVRMFQAWAAGFGARCRERGWITAAALPDRLLASLARGGWRPPPALTLAGFDAFPPRDQRFLDGLRRAGCRVDVNPEPDTAAAEVRVFVCADAREELRAAAAWAAELTAAGAPGPIGVVTPDLAGVRDDAARIFHDVLHPERPPWDERPARFHLALGPPLAGYPAAAAALAILETAPAPRPPLERLSPLLRSPFLAGGEAEWAARARLDADLRQRQRTRVSLAELRRAADGAPVLAATLAKMQRVVSGLPRTQTLGHWAESMRALLEAAGWPGRSPNSVEYQTVEAFHAQLTLLAGLETVRPGAVDMAAALRPLRELAAGGWQPRAAAAPVQILGWLEAAGTAFSHLWVMGLHDGAVPAAPRPHPFLPAAWQREAGLPHATAESERAFGARRLRALLGAAPQVRLSYPARDAQGELRPSPLLAPWTAAPAAAASPAPAPPPCEELADHRAPPVAAGARGNTGLFADQSACAFRAFAHTRLGARAFPPLAAGLDAGQRGSLLHDFLHRLWTALGDSARLHALGDEGRSAAVAAAAAAAVADWGALQGRPGLAPLEAARLRRLGAAWLEVERGRPPFAVVQGEELGGVGFAGLELRLKPDRIDELPDGRRILLDYKSGAQTTGVWRGERPDAPQLPLYAVCQHPPGAAPVAAVAFAQLDPAGMRFQGWAMDPEVLPGTAVVDLEAEIARWRRGLERLAGEFLAGEAAVSPKRPQSCAFCDLGPLCRITAEARGNDDGEGREADGE